MATDAVDQTRSGALAALGRAWRGLVWFARGVTGEAKYDAYVAHERAAHPDRDPMTAKEYWRCVYREQDANPGARCC
ncbi:YbdD/YjiX family protein [Microbacterium paludicola]|uniref:YbdD/YjiX family protein n=1 Tax=Microbacterium paludicola TaxID=300019 RepID=A0A4Y9FY81_9MICO|nr:YbdD/YjiX family protein [Microbacterium paludicola]MBF0815759.1 YbdD/YjiX family protein [Microbacterium paludicola]TFU33595.1 YbdD/YjiX family protein [Microbacterium paludicola]